MSKASPKASSKKGRKTTTSSSASTPQRNAAEQQAMIAEAAYFIAEHRGFATGDELGDWLEAEHEVQASLQRQ